MRGEFSQDHEADRLKTQKDRQAGGLSAHQALFLAEIVIELRPFPEKDLVDVVIRLHGAGQEGFIRTVRDVEDARIIAVPPIRRFPANIGREGLDPHN